MSKLSLLSKRDFQSDINNQKEKVWCKTLLRGRSRRVLRQEAQSSTYITRFLDASSGSDSEIRRVRATCRIINATPPVLSPGNQGNQLVYRLSALLQGPSSSLVAKCTSLLPIYQRSYFFFSLMVCGRTSDPIYYYVTRPSPRCNLGGIFQDENINRIPFQHYRIHIRNYCSRTSPPIWAGYLLFPPHLCHPMAY